MNWCDTRLRYARTRRRLAESGCGRRNEGADVEFPGLGIREARTVPDLGSAGHADRKALFNNAAQAWNHNLYWQSLSPTPTAPSPALAAAIQRDFGSQDALNAELAKAAISDFGSGWAWLALDSGKLRVVATSNAENPMTAGMVPLLVIDVWEHAYYLDVQNRRADYVNGVIKSLLNWQSASHRLAQAGAGKGA